MPSLKGRQEICNAEQHTSIWFSFAGLAKDIDHIGSCLERHHEHWLITKQNQTQTHAANKEKDDRGVSGGH